MYFFNTRHAALKSFPNAIIRKVLKGSKAGTYTAFNDNITYNSWRYDGLVK